MYTQDPYSGSGSMMDAAEIPVKQYMPGAFTSAARPGMSASQRRSSSGVYDDEGLASTAAIRALYKQDPVAVAPHIVSSMRAGNGNGMGEQEHANVLAGGQNGIPPPLPRQGLNAEDPTPEFENDSRSILPKTLRRQPQTQTEQSPQQESARPHIPLSQRSLRRPHGQNSSPGPTSYMKLGKVGQPLPTPSKIVPTPQMIPHPEATGPSGAKTMRHPNTRAETQDMDGARDARRGSAIGSAINLPPPQGAAAAGLMTDYGHHGHPSRGSNAAPNLNSVDIPKTQTTLPSSVQPGGGVPMGSTGDQYRRGSQPMQGQERPMNSQYTDQAQMMNTQKPGNPYMPQPVAQDDLTQGLQNLSINREGEGAYISKKTLRHQPDIPDLQQEAQVAEPVQERTSLADKTLRRFSLGHGQEKESTKTGFLGKIKEKLKGDDHKQQQEYQIQNQQSRGYQQGYQQEGMDYKSQFGGGREVLTGRDVDTTVHESVSPAVVHEHVTPVIHNVEHQEITRDIHNYDVYTRIQPVKEHIELPPRHYTPDSRGNLREMSPEEVAAEAAAAKTMKARSGLAPGHIQMPTQQQQRERILVSETTITSPGGTTRTESVWRYPEEGEVAGAVQNNAMGGNSAMGGSNVMPAMNSSMPVTHTMRKTMRTPEMPLHSTMQNQPMQQHWMPKTLRANRAPSTATNVMQQRPSGFVRTPTMPRDGDIMVSQPFTPVDQAALPQKSPKRALPKAGNVAGVVASPMAMKAANVALPDGGLDGGATPVNTPLMNDAAAVPLPPPNTPLDRTPVGRAHVPESPGMNPAKGGGSVTMGGDKGKENMCIPPPNPAGTHQSVHLGRNDLGPTFHTDIDMRRPDTHESFAGLDSESYLGGEYHGRLVKEVPQGTKQEMTKQKIAQNTEAQQHEQMARQTLRRESVAREWGAVPKPSEADRVTDSQSPVGDRPSRPTPVPRAQDLRQRVTSGLSGVQHAVAERMAAMPGVEGVRSLAENVQHTVTDHMPSLPSMPIPEGMKGTVGNMQHGAQQRMTTARTTSQRFVKPATNNMQTAATNAQYSVRRNMPSVDQVKNTVASSMPETTKAVNNVREHPGEAASYATNLASNFAAGIRNLMPEHLNADVTQSTQHVPGAFDSDESDRHIDSPFSTSSESSLSSPLRDDIEKDMPELDMAASTRSNPGDPPTVMEYQNQVVPGGVIKGQHAIVGPAILMESKKIEEQMSLKRLRRMSQHENTAVNQLTTGKKAMVTPVNRTMGQQDMDGAMATKMRELMIAETQREQQQSERIQQSIEKNFLREEHDEFERAKELRRKADRAFQEAKRTKEPEHVDLAHKLEREYQESIKQNQKVLQENYRSGLGVTVGMGMTETTKHHGGKFDGVQEGTGPPASSEDKSALLQNQKVLKENYRSGLGVTTGMGKTERTKHHSGKFDGVQEGTGPAGFSPKHSTFPTGFEQSMHTAEGMMGEGTESENPYNYDPPSNTAPNHPTTTASSFQRPVNQPRRTTDKVITNHTVFPNPELPTPSPGMGGLRKSQTIPTQGYSERPSNERVTSQRFVKPKALPQNLQQATRHSPNVIATQLTAGSHSVIHPNALNVHQHMTEPVDYNARTPTNALELDPITAFTQPISHEVDVGEHTQAVPIDPVFHRIARDPVHPHTSMNIPTHPAPHHLQTAPVKHPLTRTPSQAVPIGAFPTITQEVQHPAAIGTPTQAVPIDPLTHTIPKDPLHVIDAQVVPLNPLAPSPKGEEKDRDIGNLGSPTDIRAISSTADTVSVPTPAKIPLPTPPSASPQDLSPVSSSTLMTTTTGTEASTGIDTANKFTTMDTLAEPMENMTKSQKKRAKRRAAKKTEQDRLGIPLLDREIETPEPVPEQAQRNMDRAMKPGPRTGLEGVRYGGVDGGSGGVVNGGSGQGKKVVGGSRDSSPGSPLPIKAPAGMARAGADTEVGGVRPMNWAEVAEDGRGREGMGNLKRL